MTSKRLPSSINQVVSNCRSIFYLWCIFSLFPLVDIHKNTKYLKMNGFTTFVHAHGKQMIYSGNYHKRQMRNGAFLLPMRSIGQPKNQLDQYRRNIHFRWNYRYMPFLHPGNRETSSISALKRDMSTIGTSKEIIHHEIGDVVEFCNKEGSVLKGKIIGKRGGWYSIERTDENVNETLKRRGKELISIKDNNKTDVPLNNLTRNILNTNLEDGSIRKTLSPPTMVDLDSLLCNVDSDFPLSQLSNTTNFLAQAENIAQNIHKWVIFSDLHCSPSTLTTTLDVLQTVHRIAHSQPNTGILFLGDFWHHRGSLHIPTLNDILDTLSTWRVPMIMIPGNHDQVTFRGDQHGLSALRNAYYITSPASPEKNIPGPLIFTHPTRFLNATFIPYVRDNGIMESILSSSLVTSDSTKAIFVHADVTGAFMNDAMISQGGVSPRMFPPNKMIFSGHFHKPHVLTSKNKNIVDKLQMKNNEEGNAIKIEYVGSPYEVSLSEAGQQKAILVLDSSKGWKCVERIPFNVGPKHYICKNIRDLLNVGQTLHESQERVTTIKEGDRVIFSLSDLELEQLSYEQDLNNKDSQSDGRKLEMRIKELRNLGAKVEIRTIKHAKNDLINHPMETSLQIEDMTPQTTLKMFLRTEVEKHNLSEETSEKLQMKGLQLIEELLSDNQKEHIASDETKDNNAKTKKRFSSQLSSLTDLIFTSIHIQGFGCFGDKTEYPLDSRGLVLIKGKNLDGGSDSNGSGKSTLAMSTLWALTGTMDPRPVQDRKVVDVIHDDSKLTKVTLRGYINSEPFTITRMKSLSKNSSQSLTFVLNQKDLTTQSVKETQEVINECISSGSPSFSQILARTIFHGQHALNGLLEATDAQWKEELALLVPTDIWKEGASVSRKKSQQYKSMMSEFDGMISLREKDADDLARKLHDAKLICDERRIDLQNKTEKIENDIKTLLTNFNKIHDHDFFVESQQQLDAVSNLLTELEAKKLDITAQKSKDLYPLQCEVEDLEQSVMKSKTNMEWCKREIDQGKQQVAHAEQTLTTIKSKWDKKGEGLIDVCPTCNRPLEEGEHHKHAYDRVIKGMELEISNASNAHRESKEGLSLIQKDYERKQKKAAKYENEFLEVSNKLEEARNTWEAHIVSIDNEIIATRKKHVEQASLVSQIADELNKRSEMQSMKIKYEAELQRFRDAHDSSSEIMNNLVIDSAKIQKEIESLRNESAQAKQNSKIYSQLASIFGPTGVQSFVLKDAINSLELCSQTYLDELSDKSQRLELILDSSDRITRIASIRASNGTFKERPLSSLSGGQWRRCSLALSLGFSELVARRGGFRPSLLVLDEPLTHLDARGREQVGKLLRRLVRQDEGTLGLRFSTILVILQDLAAEELGEESFDFIDEVTKSDGRSSVAIDKVNIPPFSHDEIIMSYKPLTHQQLDENMCKMEYKTTYQSMNEDRMRKNKSNGEPCEKTKNKVEKKNSGSRNDINFHQHNTNSRHSKPNNKWTTHQNKNQAIPLYFVWSFDANDTRNDNARSKTYDKSDIIHSGKQNEVKKHERMNKNPNCFKGSQDSEQNVRTKKERSISTNFQHNSSSFFISEEQAHKETLVSEYNYQYQWHPRKKCSGDKLGQRSHKRTKNIFSEQSCQKNWSTKKSAKNHSPKIFTSLKKTQGEKISCYEQGILRADKCHSLHHANEHPSRCVNLSQTNNKSRKLKNSPVIENIPYPRSISGRMRQPLENITTNEGNRLTTGRKQYVSRTSISYNGLKIPKRLSEYRRSFTWNPSPYRQ